MPQTWNAVDYARNGRFVADLAQDVFALLAPQGGERILDLGCGDGALTERLQSMGVAVIAADSSPSMVQAALARGLSAQQIDAQALSFRCEFDAVFSNAALHWMDNQHAVLDGVRAALRPGGRFVAELGGHGNIAAVRTALRAAFASMGLDAEVVGGNRFYTAEQYRGLLEQHGFQVERIELVPRPTLLPTGMRAWIETFRRSLLDALTPTQRESLLSEVTDLLEPILRDSQGNWWADYVRLRFRASVPNNPEARPAADALP